MRKIIALLDALLFGGVNKELSYEGKRLSMGEINRRFRLMERLAVWCMAVELVFTGLLGWLFAAGGQMGLFGGSTSAELLLGAVGTMIFQILALTAAYLKKKYGVPAAVFAFVMSMRIWGGIGLFGAVVAVFILRAGRMINQYNYLSGEKGFPAFLETENPENHFRDDLNRRLEDMKERHSREQKSAEMEFISPEGNIQSVDLSDISPESKENSRQIYEMEGVSLEERE